MKSPGYYWCDRCDEIAFGYGGRDAVTCQHCQSPTRWIASEPIQISATDPAAKILFQQMREAVVHSG